MTSRSARTAGERAARGAAPRTPSTLERGAPDERVLAALAREGLLLLSDARLPSIAALVAGAPVRGSWWGHPAGQTIFRISEALADHPDVLVNRLVSSKVTYVHRRLWPALLAVARSRAPWQTRSLSRPARSLLLRVEGTGTLRTDQIAGSSRRVSAVARELEDRLLVHTGWIHTERGAHARVLMSWARWARGRGMGGRPVAGARRAEEILEGVMDDLNSRCGADGRLPWQASPSNAGERPGR